jgi:hypothetical protein
MEKEMTEFDKMFMTVWAVSCDCTQLMCSEQEFTVASFPTREEAVRRACLHALYHTHKFGDLGQRYSVGSVLKLRPRE